MIITTKAYRFSLLEGVSVYDILCHSANIHVFIRSDRHRRGDLRGCMLGLFFEGGGDFAPNPHIIVPPPKLLSAPLSPVLRGKDRTNINNS